MYPYDGWKKKVRRMSDSQVLAIFMKRLNEPKPKEKIEDPRPPEDIPF